MARIGFHTMHPRDIECYRFGPKFCALSQINFLTTLCFQHVQVSGQVLESLLSIYHLLETVHVSHSMQFTNLNVGASSLTLKPLHISFLQVHEKH